MKNICRNWDKTNKQKNPKNKQKKNEKEIKRENCLFGQTARFQVTPQADNLTKSLWTTLGVLFVKLEDKKIRTPFLAKVYDFSPSSST